MNKLLEILKRKIYVIKHTFKDREIYMLHVESHQITEEEYELIKDFITRKEEEEKNG